MTRLPRLLALLGGTSFFVGALAASSAGAQIVQPGPPLPVQPLPKLVRAPLPKTLVPDGSFENAPSAAGAAPWHVDLSGMTWGAWSYGPACGIAHRNSGFLNLADLAALDGDYATYMEDGAGSLSSTVTVNATGAWRLCYTMANRVDSGGTVNLPFVEVLIDGERVAFEAPRHTDFRVYTTRVIELSAGSVSVEFLKALDPETGAISPGTALIDEVRIERVREWQDASSWRPTGVPLPNNPVSVPLGHSIALKGGCTSQSIDNEGEILALTAAATLSSRWIAIVGPGARFEVGREHVPFTGDFTLTLRGNPSQTSPYTAGTKFLMAMDGGEIDMHGTERTSWTRLVASALPSATSFVVDDAQGWEEGDELVVTGSSFNRELPTPLNGNDPPWVDYNEKVRISSITPVGGDFQIDIDPSPPAGGVAALSFEHLGGADAVTDLLDFANPPQGLPATLDQSAEVANLTRNIVVRGDIESASYSPKRFGGHIMLMRCGACANGGGIGRFSYVELMRMGQEAELGRYPFHFHMQKGDGQGQFIVGCSVHETYNRMITIHGTDSTLVRDNVGYRNQGHALFLEDGSEMYNVIERNLIMSILRPLTAHENGGVNLGVIPSDNSMRDFRDRSPAAFWITNPYNVFIDNVAAGTVGCGFWLIPPRRVTGPSQSDPDLSGRTPPIELPFMVDEQSQETLFRGNRAHDCRLGFDFNDTIPDAYYGDPQQAFDDGVRKNTSWAPTRPTNPANDIANPFAPREQTRETALDFVAYGCYAGAYGSTGGDQLIFDRMVVADCNRGTDFACYAKLVNAAIVMQAQLIHVNAPAGGANGAKAGIALYDGAGRYENTVFRGFSGGSSTAAGPRGGAVNHPNHSFVDVYFPDAVGIPPRPIIAWPQVPATQATVLGYSNVTQGAGNPSDAQNPLAPSKWGGQLFDETGQMLVTPGSALVRDVPIMRTADPDEFDYTNSSGGVPSNAVVSPHRWGHLRLVYPEDPGTTHSAMDFVIHRTSHLVYNAVPGGQTFSAGTDAVGHEHIYNSRQHKQIPIIVNTEPPGSLGEAQVPGGPPSPPPNQYFVYTIDHIDSSFLTNFGTLELIVDDALEGDVAHFRLADLDGIGFGSFEARSFSDDALLPEYTDFRQFMGATQPALYRDPANGEVHLRVPVRSAADGSTPAGRRNYFASYGNGSTNVPDSRWRNETITITWM